MKWLVKLSIKRPWVTIGVILSITLFFGVMLGVYFNINVDPMKSFSRKMDVIKYYHLTLKKFSMKDMILVGVENKKEGIYNVETIRYLERVINDFNNLTVQKTYKDIFTGEKKTVSVPSKLAPQNIVSMINADDVLVDKTTNSVVLGNLTSRARRKAGLLAPDLESMKKLPQSDEELTKLIPFLKKELEENELLRGTLFSLDGKATAIMVPVEKRIDNKLEIVRTELPVMVDANRMKERFNGQIAWFPHNIYNKETDGTRIDDEYIKDRVESGKKKVRRYFVKALEPITRYNKEFGTALEKNEVNEDYLGMVFKTIEDDACYEKPDVSLTYQDLIDDLYRFVIGAIDPFSRNNLEAKLYNVGNIYDVGHIYKIFNEITAKNKPANLNIYIAGMPVAEALLESFVMNDMSIFMSLCIVVVLIVLFLTIRTPTGIYLPLASVTISIIWLMGGMLLGGIEFSSGTMAMPSILIAVGTSYVIHFLIRFYEKVEGKSREEVPGVLLDTADSIDTAIALSAYTTMAAFISNVFMDIVDIQRLGYLLTIGFFINFIFAFSFIPACLSLMPKPPRGTKESFFERIIMKAVVKGGENTARHPRAVFWSFLGFTGIFLCGTFLLNTESSISIMFKESNPIRQADKFINRELTGTGQMCVVFKMRDRVNLAGKAAQQDLSKRIDEFAGSFKNLGNQSADLRSNAPLMTYFTDDLQKLSADPVRNQKAIEDRVTLLTDMMNEFYAPQEKEEAKKEAVKADANTSLLDLADNAAVSSGGAPTVSPQEKGVENIIARITTLQDQKDKDSAKRFIAFIRDYKRTPAGKEFMGNYNFLSDFFQTDASQPVTLRKLDEFGRQLKSLKRPTRTIDGVTVGPVGNIMSITDSLKLIYKVFYHDENEAFRKIPDVKADGIQDKSLTDRSLVNVCINQFRGSQTEMAKYLVTDDMKMMQYVVFTRSDKADFLREFQREFNAMYTNIFPADDPYVEKIVISGMPAINLKMNEQILHDQITSLLTTVFIVFLCCLFMFRSFIGALFATVPIAFTLIITLGVMGFIGVPINYSTLINASIAVGAGIDYSIHFIERFKIEHNQKGLDFIPAYVNVLKTTGVAIVTATLTVGLGFAVLGFSSFKIISVSGLLVTLSMIMSGMLSLTILPAMIVWARPGFLRKAKPWGLENKAEAYIKRVTAKYEHLKN